VRKAPEKWSILGQASLTSEEYQNPFLVFQKAFDEKTPNEFDFFLCEITHLSLSPFAEEFEYDFITPYIHLIKMLDASKVMNERGVKKLKVKNPIPKNNISSEGIGYLTIA
jgi:hypothetical protein